MTDYFALLGEPRRPWIDPEKLRKKFLSRSNEVHPDRFHNATQLEKNTAQARYTDLNAAYAHLREPKDCLRHFLELETGSKPQEVQTIPQFLMDQFIAVGQGCRETDLFLARKAATNSPLLQVDLFEEGQMYHDKITALKKSVGRSQQPLIEELRQIGENFPSVSASPEREKILPRLEEIYRLLGYYGRWQAQLQERIVQLAL